ncbi:hypothetical protein ABGB17_06810 [Sphaerisporangium sp. B11E5]|uniref:hypothetical protein n=1 Tax=Sphaerisporangium sp. B11E5 TaxID=3153563 RepID=UPI00325C7408
MSWLILAFIVTAAVLAPLFGADTRDGRDWKRTTPGTPATPRRSRRVAHARERRPVVHTSVLRPHRGTGA